MKAKPIQPQTVQPSDICFVNCFPVNPEDFYRFEKSSHFIQGQVTNLYDGTGTLFSFYNSNLLEFYQNFRDRYSSLGFDFVDRGCLAIIAEKVKSKRVIIIFAHNVDNAGIRDYETLEIYGERVNTKEIENVIPSEFDGIFDMSTCHLQFFPSQMKVKRPRTVVKSHPHETIKLVHWLYFFSHLFEIIRCNHLSYIQAYRSALRKLKPSLYDVIRTYFSLSKWKAIIGTT